MLPMTDGSLAALTPAMLIGPEFCGAGGTSTTRTAARAQGSCEPVSRSLRRRCAEWTDALEESRQVAGRRETVPDYTVAFEVTPRTEPGAVRRTRRRSTPGWRTRKERRSSSP